MCDDGIVESRRRCCRRRVGAVAGGTGSSRGCRRTRSGMLRATPAA